VVKLCLAPQVSGLELQWLGHLYLVEKTRLGNESMTQPRTMIQCETLAALVLRGSLLSHHREPRSTKWAQEMQETSDDESYLVPTRFRYGFVTQRPFFRSHPHNKSQLHGSSPWCCEWLAERGFGVAIRGGAGIYVKLTITAYDGRPVR
jgi:hypothetical protein